MTFEDKNDWDDDDSKNNLNEAVRQSAFSTIVDTFEDGDIDILWRSD